MGRWVKTASALLCLVLLLAVGGCREIARIDQDGTDSPETAAPVTTAPDFSGLLSPETDAPDTVPPETDAPDHGPQTPDFSLDELYEKNGIYRRMAEQQIVSQNWKM